MPRVTIYCQTSVETVVCTAQSFDVRYYMDNQEVTNSGQWSVVPSDIGRFTRPGLLTPLHSGEAEVHFTSDGIMPGFAPRFLVGPGRDARWIHFFALTVLETDQRTPIPGALVEMLDGYRTGATCLTNGIGYCSIDGGLTGEAFTARVSKAGYVATTGSYRVDPPVGTPGNSPFQSVTLVKQ